MLCAGKPAQASSQFFDGRLEVSGFAKETVYYRTSWDKLDKETHDSRFDFALTSLYFETIYKLRESANWNLTWFNGLRYWYEASPSYDDQIHKYMNHHQISKHQQPTRFEDVVSESYVSAVKGPWDIRVGKQIVIWGQLDMSRVADVVNPLDLRFGVPGVDNWEEIKKGLWMIRTVYQSTLPGNLIFENIINPGYYDHQYLPYDGTHWGNPRLTTNPFSPKSGDGGLFAWQQDKWYRDAPPEWSTDNWELGFRLQGYTWDIDWSLIYWNARSDNPIAIVNPALKYIGSYAFPAGVLASITGDKVRPPEWKGGKIVRFKRYQTFGGTAQTQIKPLRNSIWRLEWFYEQDSPFEKGTDGNVQNMYDTSRNDILGIAIQYNDKFDIPWWTKNIGTGKQTDLSITYFIEHIRNMDRDLVLNNRKHRIGDPNFQSLQFFLKQEMFNTSWVFVCMGNWYTMTGQWFTVPCFTYMFPGEHWRGDIGAKIYGGAKNEYTRGIMAHKDSLIFRLRYEF
jgi:hypothetical protein